MFQDYDLKDLKQRSFGHYKIFRFGVDEIGPHRMTNPGRFYEFMISIHLVVDTCGVLSKSV